MTTHDGLPGNSIRGLVQTTDGTIWVWTESGLAKWTGQQVEAVADENGLPGAELLRSPQTGVEVYGWDRLAVPLSFIKALARRSNA